MKKIKDRPAESTTLIAAAVVAGLSVADVEVDEGAVVAILLGLGALPAFVTGLVDRLSR